MFDVVLTGDINKATSLIRPNGISTQGSGLPLVESLALSHGYRISLLGLDLDLALGAVTEIIGICS